MRAGLGLKSTWCNNGWSGERVEPRQIARAARKREIAPRSAELLSAAFDSQKPHHGTFITRIKRLFLDFLLSLCFYIMWSIKFLFSTNQIQESCLHALSLYQFLSSSSRTLPGVPAVCKISSLPLAAISARRPPARASSTP